MKFKVGDSIVWVANTDTYNNYSFQDNKETGVVVEIVGNLYKVKRTVTGRVWTARQCDIKLIEEEEN